MATPWASANSTVWRIQPGSPAWKPQAMLAELMYSMTSSSRPILYIPKLSPMSQLRSIFTPMTPISPTCSLAIEYIPRPTTPATARHSHALSPPSVDCLPSRIVQSPSQLSAVRVAIDQAIVDQGIRLTAIGIGTAFTLLIVLTLVMYAMAAVAGIGERRRAASGPKPGDRDKALAAVVAVNALLARSEDPAE